MTGKTPATSRTLTDAAKGVVGWIGEGARLGMDMFGSVRLPSAPRTGAGCEIPPPCWTPQPLGVVTARACPGTAAVIRLDITNTGMVGRAIKVTVTGGSASVTPAALALGPLEEGVVVLSFDVPATDSAGQTRKLIIWVDGCKRQFLRWNIVSTFRARHCRVELAVEDGPDFIHHWYDHFYCQRDCSHD